MQVSHLSLIPVLAHDESARTELTATRYIHQVYHVSHFCKFLLYKHNNKDFIQNSRFAFTVTSNITIYIMTWVTLGVTGASQQVVNPSDVADFRVSIKSGLN